SVADPDEKVLDDVRCRVAVACDPQRQRVHTRGVIVVEDAHVGHRTLIIVSGGLRCEVTGYRSASLKPVPSTLIPSARLKGLPVNWLVKNFLRGLVIVVPVAVTLWVIVRAFNAVDQLVAFKIPGIGVVIILGGTLLVGVLASNFVGRRFVAWTHVLFTRAPLVRIIYASIRDLLEAFGGDKKRFERPVAVSINHGVR